MDVCSNLRALVLRPLALRPLAPRPLALLCLLSASLGLGSGCSVADGPELLEVSSVGPGLVESGGSLVAMGSGFPAGRPGRVELSGTSLVPGRDPERVKSTLSGQATSSGRLVVELGEDEVTALTGGAPHATFRGTFSLAFEPVRPGAPALRGHMNDLTLDVLSGGALSDSAGDFWAYLGLELGVDLSVIGVAAGGEGHAAGLRVGDRLHRLDGVRLLTLADFAPSAHGGTSLLEYSRPGYAGTAEILLSRSDYYRSDEGVLWLAVSVGLAALLGLLVAARPPRGTVWLLQAGRSMRRRTSGAGERTSSQVGWLGAAVSSLVGALTIALVQAAGSATRLDLPLLGGACLGALLLAALLADGRRTGQGFSLALGLWGALLSALGLAPVVLAWVLSAVEVGSLSLVELAASQAAAPLGVGVLSSPWTLVSAVCYLLALVPLGGERSPTAAVPHRRAPVVRVLEEFGLLLGLAAWVMLYADGLAGRSLPLALTLALGFAKLLLLLGFVRWLRGVSGRVSRGESWDLFCLPLVLTSVLAAGVRLLVLRLDLAGALDAKLRWLPLLCLVSVSTWLLLSALRSLSHQGRRADPWL